MRFVHDESDGEADEEVGPMHEKHIQNPVRKFGGERVKGVYKHRDYPLVANGGTCSGCYKTHGGEGRRTNVNAVLDIMREQARVLRGARLLLEQQQNT